MQSVTQKSVQFENQLSQLHKELESSQASSELLVSYVKSYTCFTYLYNIIM